MHTDSGLALGEAVQASFALYKTLVLYPQRTWPQPVIQKHQCSALETGAP